jgi:hypothetical protein
MTCDSGAAPASPRTFAGTSTHLGAVEVRIFSAIRVTVTIRAASVPPHIGSVRAPGVKEGIDGIRARTESRAETGRLRTRQVHTPCCPAPSIELDAHGAHGPVDVRALRAPSGRDRLRRPRGGLPTGRGQSRRRGLAAARCIRRRAPRRSRSSHRAPRRSRARHPVGRSPSDARPELIERAGGRSGDTAGPAAVGSCASSRSALPIAAIPSPRIACASHVRSHRRRRADAVTLERNRGQCARNRRGCQWVGLRILRREIVTVQRARA